MKYSIVDYPHFQEPFYLNTETSNVAIGDKLFQVHDENSHTTLGFANQVLKLAETRYTTTEQEGMALV